ncbi:uncharacterized protein A4U43_C06F4350 [Asparagus officinalis]|uniref:Uncharacterized protein n=1 Tax=Asparagus officinalis TaxID=4686 RepID=A0A5P1EQ02_ASPOF|nr:uncharacterized protein LOC109844784 [Asparagus officinalis]ONK66120.1 uncharacterized protein A4U43_C06F4350 [Asparagus officinalis]
MSCAQANAFLPNVKLGGPFRRGKRYEDIQRLVCCSDPSNYRNFDPRRSLKGRNLEFPRLVCTPLRSGRNNHLCFAKGGLKSENEGFPWESLKNAMGGMKKEESVQDWLKKRTSENEFDGDGGDGGRPGGGDGGDGADGEGDEGFSGILDEFLQVVLATIGFIFVYIYLIRGAELTRLARDYIKYLFGASASMRLRRAMDKWERFLESITRTVDTREDWLERAIVAQTTWWHKPRKLASLTSSRVDDDDDDY